MTRAPVAVLGTGMAALGASYVLKDAGVPFVRYDKNDYLGGHTRSICYPSGFTFDEGVHISFTQNERVRSVLAENVRGEYGEKDFTIDNVWRGLRIPHPVQCHLHKIPLDEAVRIVRSFISRRHAAIQSGVADQLDRSSDREIQQCKTYAEWLYTAYGEQFAEAFPMAYGEKYHTLSMDRLNTEWVGPRMYRPSLEDLLLGLAGNPVSDSHYVQRYRYPKQGGFVSFLGARDKFDTRLAHEVVSIDPHAKVLRFSNGETHSYSALLSSVPLPDLIGLIDGAPLVVIDASKRLSFSSAMLVNIGLNRSDLSSTDMTYFYDKDILISRIHLPHKLSSNNAPAGCGSIQAEVYFSERYRPLTISRSELTSKVLIDLRRTGFIQERDEILMANSVECRYANVIYDNDRSAALDIIRSYLRSTGIHCCGRYGAWDHAWTDQAFMSGDAAARQILAD